MARAANDAGAGIASRPLVLVLVMAALSLVPFVLLMGTCFVKVAVVLSILRGAIGAPQVPPTQVVTGLALILTLYVMAPTGERMYGAVTPLLGEAAGADLASGKTVEALATAAGRAKEPMRDFLLKHADGRDRASFHALALRMRTAPERAGITDRDLMVLMPAFVTSELRRAFEIGFLLFLPFLILDLVIAESAAGAGDAHAGAHHGVAAVQVVAVRLGRRLASGGARPGGELPVTALAAATAASDLLLRAVREGLLLAILLSAPPLLASLLVGFMVGVVQAATQLHDQTLSFVPKLVVVALTLLAMGPALATQLVRFSQALLLAFPHIR